MDENELFKKLKKEHEKSRNELDNLMFKLHITIKEIADAQTKEQDAYGRLMTLMKLVEEDMK